MIWFYHRAGKHLFYEVRLRNDGPGFELEICYPDGPIWTERFTTEAELSRRFSELQITLTREGWGPIERRLEGGGPLFGGGWNATDVLTH